MEQKYHVTFSRQSLPYLHYALHMLSTQREPDVDTRTLNWLSTTVTTGWQQLDLRAKDLTLALTERHMTIVSRAFRLATLRCGDKAERIRFGITNQTEEQVQNRFAQLAKEAVAWLSLPHRTPISQRASAS